MSAGSIHTANNAVQALTTGLYVINQWINRGLLDFKAWTFYVLSYTHLHKHLPGGSDGGCGTGTPEYFSELISFHYMKIAQ